MVYLIICTVALAVSALTLFSGFGLGTLLMPAFAIFFPVEVAVGATAIVHPANNMFKLVLVGRMADIKIVLRFAIPASITAVIGALLLNYFANVQPVTEYTLAGRLFTITVVKLVIAVLIASLAILELSPRFKKLSLLKNQVGIGLITAAILVAFLGSFIGSRMVKKITMNTIKVIVGILLLLLAVALGSGLV